MAWTNSSMMAVRASQLHLLSLPFSKSRQISLSIGKSLSPPPLRLSLSHHDQSVVSEYKIEKENDGEKGSLNTSTSELNKEVFAIHDGISQTGDVVEGPICNLLEKTKCFMVATIKAVVEMGVDIAPVSIKDAIEAAQDTHLEDLKRLSRIHDFCFGIPFGGVLASGGLLRFFLTGNIDGVRFGVFFGGLILYLSILSFQSWKQEKETKPYIAAQAAVTLIIFLQESHQLSMANSSFAAAILAVTSAVMLLFYAYTYVRGAKGQQCSPQQL